MLSGHSWCVVVLTAEVFAQGNLGGGLATWVSEWLQFEDEDYRKVFVLSGMAAALGSLFPTPMLGALMIHELGNPPKYALHLLLSSCLS